MLFSCSRILSLSGAIFGGSSGYPRCLVESDDAQDSQLTDIVGELAAKLLTLELSLQKKDEELTQVRRVLQSDGETYGIAWPLRNSVYSPRAHRTSSEARQC